MTGQRMKGKTSWQRSLYAQVRMARIWLPVTIVGVVLIHQLAIVPLGDETWQFWTQLLFYSILGPLATFSVMTWIAEEVRSRERAQNELTRLYVELQASHEALAEIQSITASFAAAQSLEAVSAAAVDGVQRVTGASGVGIVLGVSQLGLTASTGLTEALKHDALARDASLRDNNWRDHTLQMGRTGERYVFSAPVVWAGEIEGSLTAYYESEPTARQRETLGILTQQFSAATEAARARTRDVLTLIEVDRSIRAEGNLERLLQTLLEQMLRYVGASVGMVYLSDEENLFSLNAIVGQPRPTRALHLRLEPELHRELLELPEPHLVDSAGGSIRGGAAKLLSGSGTAIVVPLSAEEQLFGVIVLSHPTADGFSGGALPFLSLLGSQVALAVRNATAYRQSEELAIVEERSRIAREIHDGVAQMLAFAALKLDLVKRLLTRDLPAAEDELALVQQTLRESIREIRRSIFALRPVALERHGLVETVRRYTGDFGQQNDVQIELTIDELPQLSVKSEAVLFRIFQEAMHNVAKHAKATRVAVSLGRDEQGRAVVRVSDNGVGFDTNEITDRVTSAGGLGLKQMEERVAARGGELTIESLPGEGSTIQAAIGE